MPPHTDHQDVWAVAGRFRHLVYSPKGGVEGIVIDTDGIATQFVLERDHDAAAQLASLQPDQPVVVEGTERPASDKGAAAHFVYDFHRLAEVGGQAPQPDTDTAGGVHGRVARLNYAKHGAPNGVVLDTGDFVHMRPDGFERINAAVGDALRAEGPGRPLADGRGRVIEATHVNGTPLRAGPAP